MTTRFDKMHGLGNDFVILDGRQQPVAMTERLAKGLSDRHLGIGCDQLILLEPSKVAWDPLESTCRHASLSIL